MRKAYLDISADEREKGKRDSGPAEIQKKKSRPPSHLEISLEKAKAEGDAEKIEFFQRQLDFLAGKAPLFSKDKKSEWPFPKEKNKAAAGSDEGGIVILGGPKSDKAEDN